MTEGTKGSTLTAAFDIPEYRALQAAGNALHEAEQERDRLIASGDRADAACARANAASAAYDKAAAAWAKAGKVETERDADADDC